MPRGGKLTMAEQTIAKAYAETGSRAYAQHAAGVQQPAVSKALQRPSVQAEIVREQTRILYETALPLAVGRLVRILQDDKIRPSDHNQAIKIALAHTLGGSASAEAKDPHEMAPDELAKALSEAKLRAAALESVKADRSRPVVELEADAVGVFD